MSNSAYDLQGRNGVDQVLGTYTFTGRSVGLLVADTANLAFTVLDPAGSPVSVTLSAAPAGFFPGGTVTSVVVTTGTVLVYPVGAYTIELT